MNTYSKGSKGRETTVTVHGEVDYETRTCASCGQEFLPEDVNTAFRGRVKEVSEYTSFTSVQFSRVDKVHFCEMCSEQPVRYILPEKVRPTPTLALLVGVLLGLLVGVMVL